SVRVWDVATGTEIALLKGHSSVILSVAYSPNGKHIVSGSFDRSIRVWDKSSYISQTSCYSPTLAVESDSWVYQPTSQNGLLLWVPPFLPILHTASQIIISQSLQVDIVLHNMVHGPDWANI
ncbi:hypothetical protein BD779DRAFT_1420054, partial [Infundibulicybe gibba]